MCEDAILILGANVQTSCCSWRAGLDSSNAARVVDILSGLASAGVTVIITIHQPRPDVFNLMQRVLILSGDGRMVYSGTSFILLLVPSFAPSLTHATTQTIIHPLIHSFIHSSINSCIHSAIHPAIPPAIHPFIHQFIHLFKKRNEQKRKEKKRKEKMRKEKKRQELTRLHLMA